jgi:hypothetical protein
VGSRPLGNDLSCHLDEKSASRTSRYLCCGPLSFEGHFFIAILMPKRPKGTKG